MHTNFRSVAEIQDSKLDDATVGRDTIDSWYLTLSAEGICVFPGVSNIPALTFHSVLCATSENESLKFISLVR